MTVLVTAARGGAVAVAARNEPFEQRRPMACNDVLSVAVEQAQLWGLTTAQLGLGALDVDALLRHRRDVA